MLTYYLGLGSNLGNRKDNLSQALKFLHRLGEVQRVSSVYETEPVGMPPGTGYFYNQVVCLETGWSPPALLTKLKGFEADMGRDLSDSHFRSRIIDLDILLAGNLVLNTPNLIIPHKELTHRAFVMRPLSEIAPDLKHPKIKKSMAQILATLDDVHICRLIT